MKLKLEFKAVYASLMNRSPVPTLDLWLGELLCEEQCLLTQGAMSHDKFTIYVVFVSYYAHINGIYCDMG